MSVIDKERYAAMNAEAIEREAGWFSPSPYLVILTACIDPVKDSVVMRSDPKVRLRDYQDGLSFWLNHPDPRLQRILFVDNSGYPLDALKSLPGAGKVEFISLDCNTYPPQNSYGYAEMRMIDLALQQTRQQSTHIIKATGRLTFPNISRLLDHIPLSIKFAVDARKWQTPWSQYKRPFIPTQLMVFQRDFYASHLQTSYEEMVGTDHWIESFLYEKLRAFKGGLMRFPVSADPVGMPAHRQESYTSGRQMAINRLRSAARVLAPNWWI